MFAIIFFAVLVLFANEGKALNAFCCEEIESLWKNKTTAYKTVCLGTYSESKLSSNCCKNIANEIEKLRYAYETLCDVALTGPPCNIPLGIENGSIADVAMTSSTFLDASSLPHFARLKSQLGSCAWMPATTADRNSSWLQVDLGRLTKVSAVATQGSCSEDKWTKSYFITYSKNGADWISYAELGTTKVFIGNNDRNSIVTNHFKSSFEARFVRISPRSWHKNAALRIELFTGNCQSSVQLRNAQTPPPPPRSCLDHMKNGLKTNGYYNIYDASSNLVTVYCDMTSEPGKAWTLVMSHATSNKDMAEFRVTPLYSNAPVEQSLPNWNKYRMSLARMNDLSSQSTHWRATCSFPTHGVDYVDYIGGKFADFDVINFKGSRVCKRVEYVNIRGHNCTDCTLPWWQGEFYHTDFVLHTDSTYTHCDLNAKAGSVNETIKGYTVGEDNFGFYRTVNPKFRCTANPSATTNWWFGGNVVLSDNFV